MNRLFALCVLAGVANSGCLSDCSISEATGVLDVLAKKGCSSSASVLENGGLDVNIGTFGFSDALIDELRVSIPPPIVVGLRGTGHATVGNGGVVDKSLGSGVADYVITGVRLREGTSEPSVDLDLSCPHIDASPLGHASFRGHVSMLVVDLVHGP